MVSKCQKGVHLQIRTDPILRKNISVISQKVLTPPTYMETYPGRIMALLCPQVTRK